MFNFGVNGLGDGVKCLLIGDVVELMTGGGGGVRLAHDSEPVDNLADPCGLFAEGT